MSALRERGRTAHTKPEHTRALGETGQRSLGRHSDSSPDRLTRRGDLVTTARAAVPGDGAAADPLRHRYAVRCGSTSPRDTARLYVCGITPYDATHLGHAATYVAFDLVNRVWLDAGIDVHYVQNVTDIDDPLLERAVATGQDWNELARAETALFRDDMTALGVLPPTDFIGAVESIGLVVARIEDLLHAGAAYRVDDDIYYSVASDPDFGFLSGYDRNQMLELSAERGGDPQREGKKDPLDALLWQAERPGEPAWDTPFGHGRPGWHIECTAIALHYLGNGFDVQGEGTTSSSRTTRWAHPKDTCSLGGRLPRTLSTRAWWDSMAKRCRSRRATWYSCRGSAMTVTTRWRSVWRFLHITTGTSGTGCQKT